MLTHCSERIKKAKEDIDRQFGNLVAVELAYLICLTPEFVHYVAGRPDQGVLWSYYYERHNCVTDWDTPVCLSVRMYVVCTCL